jgi:glycosyltransferase involved in cell wall biosynthesis
MWGEPGNTVDLAAKLELLLDNAVLRRRKGLAERRRFGEEFTWQVIIGRRYRPLL